MNLYEVTLMDGDGVPFIVTAEATTPAAAGNHAKWTQEIVEPSPVNVLQVEEVAA